MSQNKQADAVEKCVHEPGPLFVDQRLYGVLSFSLQAEGTTDCTEPNSRGGVYVNLRSGHWQAFFSKHGVPVYPAHPPLDEGDGGH